jgi:2-C-methyl-D-erythritol 4-phosphate cytidylyltransferase
MKLIAIVPAAGLGKRFDPTVKKTMFMVKGLPILIHTLMRLNKSKLVSEIIPVINEEDMEEWIGIIEASNISKVKKIVPGGKERQDSVFNALRLLKEEDLVLIHDGVRPIFPVGLIDRLVNDNEGFDGIVPGLPVRETIKTVGPDGVVVATANRDKFWTVQTPQVFPLKVLKKAYESAFAERFYATDDAALVERLGGKVKIIEGSPLNIKITAREDIDIVEYLLDKGDIGLN